MPHPWNTGNPTSVLPLCMTAFHLLTAYIWYSLPLYSHHHMVHICLISLSIHVLCLPAHIALLSSVRHITLPFHIHFQEMQEPLHLTSPHIFHTPPVNQLLQMLHSQVKPQPSLHQAHILHSGSDRTYCYGCCQMFHPIQNDRTHLPVPLSCQQACPDYTSHIRPL